MLRERRAIHIMWFLHPDANISATPTNGITMIMLRILPQMQAD